MSFERNSQFFTFEDIITICLQAEWFSFYLLFYTELHLQSDPHRLLFFLHFLSRRSQMSRMSHANQSTSVSGLYVSGQMPLDGDMFVYNFPYRLVLLLSVYPTFSPLVESFALMSYSCLLLLIHFLYCVGPLWLLLRL